MHADHSGEKQLSILHAAAWQGHPDVVRVLVSRGADLEARDFEQMTPLMRACHFRSEQYSGDVHVIYWLLDGGADPNALTPRGESPLLLCVGEKLDHWLNARRAYMAQLLLRAGRIQIWRRRRAPRR